MPVSSWPAPGATSIKDPATASAAERSRRIARPDITLDYPPVTRSPRRGATETLLRVSLDVGGEGGVAVVGPVANVDELAAAVVESGCRERESAFELVRNLLIGVQVARVGDGELGQEVARGVLAVVRVDAEEGHL